MKIMVMLIALLTCLATWWHTGRQTPRRPWTHRLARSAVAGLIVYFAAMSLLLIGANRP